MQGFLQGLPGHAGATPLHFCTHQRFAQHQVVLPKRPLRMLTCWLCFIMRFAFLGPAGQLQPDVDLAWLQVCRGQTLHLTHFMARLFPELQLLGGLVCLHKVNGNALTGCQVPAEEVKEPPLIILSVKCPS